MTHARPLTICGLLLAATFALCMAFRADAAVSHGPTLPPDPWIDPPSARSLMCKCSLPRPRTGRA